MKDKTISFAIGFVGISFVIIIIGLLFYYMKKQDVEDGCKYETTVFTSDRIRCSPETPVVHVTMLGKQASIKCCKQ